MSRRPWQLPEDDLDLIEGRITPLAAIARHAQPEELAPLVTTLEEFAAVDEPGAEALAGGDAGPLIPANGDVMVYGDGGAGKTTLTVDLAFHLAAGDTWLGIPVARPLRVLLIENEGPRPLFREKLRRKLAAWQGSPIAERIRVYEAPWASLDLTNAERRELLARVLADLEIDVAIIGPVSRIGMNDAGTLQDVRDFMGLVADVRDRADRAVTFVLIHHENKGGKVSGAWEGSGDTLLHVSGQGHGRTRVYVQKARWASSYHATALNLTWTDGEGFELDETPDVSDEEVAEQILAAVAGDPGAPWSRIEKATPGVGRDRRNHVRDGLLAGRRIVNLHGTEALDHVAQGKRTSLYQADDPAVQQLLLRPGEVGEKSSPATPVADGAHFSPPSPRRGGADGGEVPDPPATLTDEDGGW